MKITYLWTSIKLLYSVLGSICSTDIWISLWTFTISSVTRLVIWLYSSNIPFLKAKIKLYILMFRQDKHRPRNNNKHKNNKYRKHNIVVFTWNMKGLCNCATMWTTTNSSIWYVQKAGTTNSNSFLFFNILIETLHSA